MIGFLRPKFFPVRHWTVNYIQISYQERFIFDVNPNV